MDLYLIPDNPENTTLMSANGVAHYRVTTMESSEGSVTYLQQPSETLEGGLLAELLSQKGYSKTSIVRSTLLGDMRPKQGKQGVDANKFLYRKGRFNGTARYFLGNDGAEYCWRFHKSVGWTLVKCGTGDEITQQVRWTSQEGVFAGQTKCALRIYPCMLDIELIVLTFILVEKWRLSQSEKGGGVGVGVGPEMRDREDNIGDVGVSGGEEGSLTGFGEM